MPSTAALPTLEGIIAGRDEVLAKGVEILREAIDAEAR